MEERSPFKDLTNVTVSGPSRSTPHAPANKKTPSGKGGWYARLSDEKKAEYLNNPRESRRQKKTAAALAINVGDETPSSLIGSAGTTPLKDITNILPTGNSDNLIIFAHITCTVCR
jgi:hypothetical protein